jgi:hypothetical protein
MDSSLLNSSQPPMTLIDWFDLRERGTVLTMFVSKDRWDVVRAHLAGGKSIFVDGHPFKVFGFELFDREFRQCLTGVPLERATLGVLVEGNFARDRFKSRMVIDLEPTR